MTLIDQIKSSFLSCLATEFQEVPVDIIKNISITLNVDPSKKQFGDLSSNAALVLANHVHKNPRFIADHIIKTFIHDAIVRCEVAGPGFINLFLSLASIQQCGRELYLLKEAFFKKNDQVEPTNHYSVEFVSANPTGPLHIGHGRGGIIGDVLARVLRARGHAVTTEFYINDAGSQISKLGLSLKIRCQQLLGQEIDLPEDAYHGEYLKNVASDCLNQYGNQVLQQSPTFFETYGKDKLLHSIQQTLHHYKISFDVWFSEKTLHEDGSIAAAIELLNQRGYIYRKDDALWFASTKFGDDKDRVVQKQSGELTYVAADIAYLINKIHRGFTKIAMVLGQDHHSYATRLKAIVQALGYDATILDVILYQLVTLKESGELVRLSKRAGKIVSLEEIIDTVGADVARFFYLHRKAEAHLDFDIDLALKRTEENPVFYIHYAYVRTASIIEKATDQFPSYQCTESDAQFLATEESALIKKIMSLKDILYDINQTNHTHLLAYYVIELAREFHSYYAQHKVIQADNLTSTKGRLFLIHLVRSTMSLCFDLLGVSKPHAM